MKYNLAYLGQISHHAENLAILLRSRGQEIHLLEDSASQGIYDQTPFRPRGSFGKHLNRSRAKASRAFSQICGTFEKEFCEQLIRIIDERKIDLVLAYWGTNPLGDIIFLKRARPKVRVILNVLCHPMGLTYSKVLSQNLLIKYGSKFVDGLVFPSQHMKLYFEANCNLKTRSLVMPAYLSEEYSTSGGLPPLELSPNLVFLGRMDWKAGQPSDNVEAQLRNIIKTGIHVFHSRSKTCLSTDENQHQFDPLEMRELSPFMSQFDASLVLYNLDKCRRKDRFRNTIPDRLLSSVAAAIPIAIPRHGYDACLEFLRFYRAVIQFDSPIDLRDKLSDKSFVKMMKDYAKEDHVNYFGERHVDKLLEFIEQL